jgi:hypothetical protein
VDYERIRALVSLKLPKVEFYIAEVDDRPQVLKCGKTVATFEEGLLKRLKAKGKVGEKFTIKRHVMTSDPTGVANALLWALDYVGEAGIEDAALSVLLFCLKVLPRIVRLNSYVTPQKREALKECVKDIYTALQVGDPQLIKFSINALLTELLFSPRGGRIPVSVGFAKAEVSDSTAPL